MSARKPLLKIVLVGEAAVGKSTLMHVYVRGHQPPADIAPTVGADFLSKEVVIGDRAASLQLWDTAGAEKFRSVTTAFYRGSDGLLLVFDLTNAATFAAIREHWAPHVRSALALDSLGRTGRGPLFALVGNKSDAADRRAVSRADADALAAQLQVPYFETSALQPDSVGKAVDAVLRIVDEEREQIYNVTMLSDFSGRRRVASNDNKNACGSC